MHPVSETGLRLRRHMPELDAVRGLAVLMVVVYHGMFWSYPIERTTGLTHSLLRVTQPGWLGVDLFFVLSGFLITGILVESRERADYYSRFYKRRALRILPAYLACLAILLLLGQVRWPFAAVSALFCANLAGLFSVPMEYGPLWSLAVEEHFYLLWPTAAKKVTRRGLLALAAAIVMVTPILRLWAFGRGEMAGLYSYTWFRLDGLALGALLAISLREPSMTVRRSWTLVLGAALLSVSLIVLGAPHGMLTRTRPLGAALQFTAASLLFFSVVGSVVLIGERGRWSPARWGVLRFFGEISYGLYLIHMLVFSLGDAIATRYGLSWTATTATPQLVVTRFLVLGGFAVAVALLSRRTLEAYFLRMKGSEAPTLSLAVDAEAAATSASAAEVPPPAR